MHTVNLVLNSLIFELGFLSLQDLNSRINWFNYGRDIDGKPSEFAEERFFFFMLNPCIGSFGKISVVFGLG